MGRIGIQAPPSAPWNYCSRSNSAKTPSRPLSSKPWRGRASRQRRRVPMSSCPVIPLSRARDPLPAPRRIWSGSWSVARIYAWVSATRTGLWWALPGWTWRSLQERCSRKGPGVGETVEAPRCAHRLPEIRRQRLGATPKDSAVERSSPGVHRSLTLP